MDFKELCARRVSVRDFDRDREISREDLDYILTCARYAPSACNRQPWRIVVMASEKALGEVREAYKREWLEGAKVVLAVVADHGRSWHREASDNKDHADVDAAIITEHICLAAAEKGIGTCWICAFDPDVAKRMECLGIGEGEETVAMVAMGYPKDADVMSGKDKEARRKGLGEIVSFV